MSSNTGLRYGQFTCTVLKRWATEGGLRLNRHCMATRAKREIMTGLLTTIPTTRIFGGEKEREKKKRILQITLWCHQHVTFSQRREKSNQNLTEKAKERGEGRGRMIDLFADKEPERMWAKRKKERKKTRKCSTREKSKTTVMSDREGCGTAQAQNHGQWCWEQWGRGAQGLGVNKDRAKRDGLLHNSPSVSTNSNNHPN